MEPLTKIFLFFLFSAIYFFVFFILISIHGYGKIFFSPKPKKKYTISFIVPAFNEEKTIGETVKAIFNSDYNIFEVIAVNDGSKDNTLGVIQSLMKTYPRLRLINKKNSGKADSLNQAIKIARGELIAVTDADSYPNPDAVGRMVGFFNDDRVGAVTSCVFLKNRNTFFEKIQEIEYVTLAWTRKLTDIIDSVYVTNGPLSVYRRSAIDKVGGFDTRSITEDIEITWHILSAGYKTRMALNARVYSTVPTKIRSWWRQRVRWGIGGIETIIKYRKDFFRKGMFGYFIMPFVAFTIFMSIAAFIFGIYLIFKQIALTSLYAGYSVTLQSSIFNVSNMNTSPTIMFIMIAILFCLTFTYSTLMLKTMDQGHILKIRKLFNRLFYMLVYLTFYPIVWFEAIYRVIRKEHIWR